MLIEIKRDVSLHLARADRGETHDRRDLFATRVDLDHSWAVLFGTMLCWIAVQKEQNIGHRKLVISVNHLVLDLLKPHAPNLLEFARSIAAAAGEATVKVKVVEMDEKTETLVVVLDGRDLQFEKIEKIISSIGVASGRGFAATRAPRLR